MGKLPTFRLRMKHIGTYLALLFLSCVQLRGQQAYESATPPSAENQLYVKETTGTIILDGVLDEAAWFEGGAADQFWQYFPQDTVRAVGKTEIRMTYNKEFLYVGIKCHSLAQPYITPSLRRDYNFSGSDNVSILFDAFNDRTNAFLFGMNPYGVRREALIANGGRINDDFSGSWDNKWYGEAKIHDTYWVAEFAIPFKTLRFKEGSQHWRFNSYRFDTHANEITTWAQIPRNQIIMDLAYMGEMVWDKPLKKPGSNVSVIPYLIGNTTQDFEDLKSIAKYGYNVGADAKIAVTSGLNLDLTLNPDFSQVEVDQQVTNLDRFEIFFPERRQFFLENADLFSSFGQSRVNPFFSRRIGVALDTATGQNIQNTILYGARLSGKLNENLRVGLLNMQSARQLENGLPGFNYTVAALQQKVFSRSNISFIFVNKEAVNGSDYGGDFTPFNRVAGLEYRIATPDNRWTGKAFWHQLLTPTTEAADQYSQGLKLEYLKRDFRLEWSHVFVGEGFDAEVGYVPRHNILMMSPEVGLFIYPKKGLINQHTIGLDARAILKPRKEASALLPAWGVADRDFEGSWEMSFRDNSSGSIKLTHNYVFLLNDFDPTRIQEDSVFLPEGAEFGYASVSASYQSNRSKKFSALTSPVVGQFYNGFRAGVRGSITYRYQPYGFVSLAYTYNHIRLPNPFQPANLWLIGPRFDLTFSKSVFLTTFFQYNNQLDNLNINARFQWRFQPVSDFFIVYTDNYFVDPFSQFSVRNRALVAKLTYWLNI